ncbi:MAG: magnesium/cobalt transporter CorA [Bacteroidetes bacterium]|nr:MAG: magnesium/cobalt transporter CorA [Bacteroidota bacterium]
MSKKKRRKIHKHGLPPGTLIYTGDREHAPAAIQSVWFTPEQYISDLEYRPDWIQQKETGVIWYDIRSLTDTALVERVGTDFSLHPLALEDILNTQQRPKLEEYENSLFFILHNFRLEVETLDLLSEQIAVFLGPNFVISFQEDADDTLSPVRVRAENMLGRMRKRGADYLCYAMLDTVIDNYFSVLEDIESQLTDIENTILTEGAQEELKARIFALKRVINHFRHRILPLRDATHKLYRTDADLVEENTRPFLRDLADHVTQILERVDSSRELLTSVEALYQAEVSNRLNNVMRLLTIISTIFIPLSFIAGLYGMNFVNMPELHWKYGYFIVLGVMAAASLAMLHYFHKKDWI